MSVRATAPGKIVVLGEYAVLAGAPALVVAVDRRCWAEIGPSSDERCHLRIAAPDPVETHFPVGDASGVALVDIVRGAFEPGDEPAWSGCVDSGELFDGQSKLGIGSSAAVLVAWAAVWSRYVQHDDGAIGSVHIEGLIELHRVFQGDSGSGLDVAASLVGGVLTYQLGPELRPSLCSVELPNSVGFTIVYSGRPAATGDFLAAFGRWRASRPTEAAETLSHLQEIAEQGCAAAGENDAKAFLAAVAAYGKRLEELGRCMEAEIVTTEHREIAGHSERFGVAYKVSGAGGGDLGIAMSADLEALAAFKEAVGASYRVIDLPVATSGLSVEEL